MGSGNRYERREIFRHIGQNKTISAAVCPNAYKNNVRLALLRNQKKGAQSNQCTKTPFLTNPLFPSFPLNVRPKCRANLCLFARTLILHNKSIMHDRL